MDSLLEDVRSLFLPATSEHAAKSQRIGAELEMIPLHAANGKRVLAQSGSPSGSEFVTSLGREFGWDEQRMDPDPSTWDFADGRVTFEPGGQIELSSAVFPTGSALIQSMQRWMSLFNSRAKNAGIELRTVGIDDRNPITDVPLQLGRDRYTAMTRYFDSIGPFGIVMMRQTASLQINVDRGERPLERWHLLNSLAPYLIAIFANSPSYAGADTGHKSYRAHIWRMLDPRRTGITWDARDPIGRYLEFALDAPVILSSREGYPTFRELLEEKSATKEIWDVHLSTLFPEIRPREYFEIRSIDAIEPAHVCAAVALVCGVVYAENSALAAMELLGDPDPALLVRAGQVGLDDSEICVRSTTLVQLAIEGCRALGPAYIGQPEIRAAESFFANRGLLN